MAQWRKANPKLAEALDKRNAERGTSKTTNPLMKDFIPRIKEREAKAEADKPKPATPATPSTDAKAGPLSGNFGRDVGYKPSKPGPDGGNLGNAAMKITERPFDPKADLLKKKKDEKKGK